MTQMGKDLMLLVMSEQCYENYFFEHNYFDVPCFQALLSKGLGIAIIAASVLVKVPQIQKILHNKSAKGINFLSVLSDLAAITFHISYSFVKGFPFSSWGDGSFLGIQTAIIGALVLFYNGSIANTIAFLISYVILLYCLMSGLTSITILSTLQALIIPILLAGRLSQAWTNYQNKSTGQLSAITCFMLFIGAVVRIFTSIQETGDFMIILTFCVSAFANAIIVVQLLCYWNSDKQLGTKGMKTSKVDGSTKLNKTKNKAKKAD